MPQFLHRFGEEVDGSWIISSKNQQILNAAMSVGLFVSAFAAGAVSDWIGRRKVTILASVICFAGVLVQYFANSIITLFGGKLLASIGFGLGEFTSPVFVAEIAPDHLRGVCLALIVRLPSTSAAPRPRQIWLGTDQGRVQNTMIVIGQWASSLTVYGCKLRSEADAWRIPLICQIAAPSLLFLIGVGVLPESPSWLLMRNRRDDARKALQTFWGPNHDAAEIEASLDRVETAIQLERSSAESKASWIECFRGPNLRRTTIVVMVFLAQQLIGVNFVVGYLRCVSRRARTPGQEQPGSRRTTQLLFHPGRRQQRPRHCPGRVRGSALWQHLLLAAD